MLYLHRINILDVSIVCKKGTFSQVTGEGGAKYNQMLNNLLSDQKGNNELFLNWNDTGKGLTF